MDFDDYDVSKIVKLCKNCGHDIGFHRFYNKYRPTACLVSIESEDGNNKYCPCHKFIE